METVNLNKIYAKVKAIERKLKTIETVLLPFEEIAPKEKREVKAILEQMKKGEYHTLEDL